MSDIKQIICINWGTRYGARYINRLYAMVARNITPPFSFTCFTDNRDGVRGEIQCEDLPPIDASMPRKTPGKWPKSRLWGETLGSLSGPVLFLDLDIIVLGSLDPFFSQGSCEDVILSINPSTPLEKLGQTSAFRFPVGKLAPIQRIFAADPQAVADEYRFEQRYVTRNAPGGVTFFPRSHVRQFTHDCCWAFPLNYILTPRHPKGARLVIFAGDVDPELAIAGRRARVYPEQSALQHLKGAFSPDRPDRLWALSAGASSSPPDGSRNIGMNKPERYGRRTAPPGQSKRRSVRCLSRTVSPNCCLKSPNGAAISMNTPN